MNLLKIFAYLGMAIVLVSCAGSRQEVKFVPVQVSWELGEELDSSDSYVSGCMVQMTNALMAYPEVQKRSSEELSFVAFVEEKKEDSGRTLHFSGANAVSVPENSLAKFSAECSAEGKIIDLKFESSAP